MNTSADKNDFNQAVRGAKPDTTLDDEVVFQLFCKHVVEIIERLPEEHRGLSKLYNHLTDMFDANVPRERGYFIESDVMITVAIDGFKPWEHIEQKETSGSVRLGSFINEHMETIGYRAVYRDDSLYEAGSGKKVRLVRNSQSASSLHSMIKPIRRLFDG